jgi:hypothetical protein
MCIRVDVRIRSHIRNTMITGGNGCDREAGSNQIIFLQTQRLRRSCLGSSPS